MVECLNMETHYIGISDLVRETLLLQEEAGGPIVIGDTGGGFYYVEDLKLFRKLNNLNPELTVTDFLLEKIAEAAVDKQERQSRRY